MNEETLSTDLSNTLDALEAERARRQDAEHVLRHIAALPLPNPAVDQARRYLWGLDHR